MSYAAFLEEHEQVKERVFSIALEMERIRKNDRRITIDETGSSYYNEPLTYDLVYFEEVIYLRLVFKLHEPKENRVRHWHSAFWIYPRYFESDNWKADWLNDVANGVIIPGWYYTIDLEDLA